MKAVKVGTLIAVMVSPGEDWKAVEIPSAAVPSPLPTPGTLAKPTVSAPSETE